MIPLYAAISRNLALFNNCCSFVICCAGSQSVAARQGPADPSRERSARSLISCRSTLDNCGRLGSTKAPQRGVMISIAPPISVGLPAPAYSASTTAMPRVPDRYLAGRRCLGREQPRRATAGRKEDDRRCPCLRLRDQFVEVTTSLGPCGPPKIQHTSDPNLAKRRAIQQCLMPFHVPCGWPE